MSYVALGATTSALSTVRQELKLRTIANDTGVVLWGIKHGQTPPSSIWRPPIGQHRRRVSVYSVVGGQCSEEHQG